jgi:threonine aldolase
VLLDLDWVRNVVPVQTNIVVIHLNDASKRDVIIQLLKDNGVFSMAFGEGMMRMVTHLDISTKQIDETSEILKKIAI